MKASTALILGGLFVALVCCSASTEQAELTTTAGVETIEPAPSSDTVEPAPPDEPRGPTTCTTDDDCVMSIFPRECCHPCHCSGEAFAIHVDDLQRARDFCRQLECEIMHDVQCEQCPEEPDSSEAVCRDGECSWQR